MSSACSSDVVTGDSILVDPLARVGPMVQLACPSVIAAGAVLDGDLRAGANLVVHPRASLGARAQHRQAGEGSIVLGANIEVWEGATVHAGSAVGSGTTRLRDGVMVMAYAHVGHDAQIGSRAVLSNGVQIGGHVEVGAHAVLGARAAVHQFVRIGRGAMVAAGSFVVADVPPWSMVAGDRARLIGANKRSIGCPERAGLVRRALRLLRGASPSGSDLLEAFPDAPEEIRDIAEFLDSPSRRGVCRWGRAS